MKKTFIFLLLISLLGADDLKTIYNKGGVILKSSLHNGIEFNAEFEINNKISSIISFFQDYKQYPKWKSGVSTIDVLSENKDFTLIAELKNRPWPFPDITEKSEVTYQQLDPNTTLITFKAIELEDKKIKSTLWHLKNNGDKTLVSRVTKITGVEDTPSFVSESMVEDMMREKLIIEIEQMKKILDSKS